MKLTTITPTWENIPISDGWSGGYAQAYKRAGVVHIRFRMMKSAGAPIAPFSLPLHLRPKSRKTFYVHPETSISGATEIIMYTTAANILVTMSSAAPLDTWIVGEISFTALDT